MLELRPNCECCNKDLPPSSVEVVICSLSSHNRLEHSSALCGRVPWLG